MTECNAKAKRTGKKCRAQAIRGKTKCRVHGGMNEGAPKDNQNAKTHGAYSEFLDADDNNAITEVKQALDNLDGDITMNEVMRMRGFKLTTSNKPEEKDLGLKLIENSVGQARRLKVSRQELKQAQPADDNQPLPWDEDE